MDELRDVEEARAGSAEAFGRLLRAHQARVRAFLGRFAHDREVVDDLAQETFLAAFRSLEGYRPETPFRLWLLGIARHRALRHLREEQRRRAQEPGLFRHLLAGWLADAVEARPEQDHDREVEALRACLESLPGRSAALVTEVYFRRTPAARVAREEGRSEGALWMTLLRIRQALRRCIQSKLPAPETAP